MVEVRLNKESFKNFIIKITDFYSDLNFEFDNGKFRMFSLIEVKPLNHQIHDLMVLNSINGYALFGLDYKQLIRLEQFLANVKSNYVILKFDDFKMIVLSDNEKLEFEF